jgi:titin
MAEPQGASTFPEASGPLRIGSDDAGNVLLLLIKGPALTLQAARWKAPLSRPSIAHVTSTSGSLSIDFSPPRVLDPADAVLNYEYSIDDGSMWTARTPASPASPIVLDGLIDGEEYPVRLRAVNTMGPGTPSAASILTPGLVAPANLAVASVTGNTVTFVWHPPSGGVPLTGYMLEGGAAPGTAPVRVPRPGTGTIFTVAAPNGTFYVRVRATRGRSESQPSNEVVLNVGVPGPPSAPTNLLGFADGGHLALAWQNTFTGGAPSDIVLDVSGDRSESFPLGGVNERFSFAAVPPGTYTFAVRAVNVMGPSSASNAVTLTFPGTCSAPQTPTSLSLSKQSDTISAFWSLPAGGAAPTGYILNVSGAINQSFNLTERTVTGTVPHGTYTISVSAANACGSSPPTPAKTITIP